MSLLENLNQFAYSGQYEVVKRLFSDQWKGVFFTRDGHTWTFNTIESAFVEFMVTIEQTDIFNDNGSDLETLFEFGILNLDTNKLYQIAPKADCSGLILFDPETGTVLQEQEFDWLAGKGSNYQHKQL